MDRNEAIKNGFGMFLNAFIAGLVATVIPAIIASINTVSGTFNNSWAAILATLTVNLLTAIILGLNEYLRTSKLPLGAKKLATPKSKGFLPW